MASVSTSFTSATVGAPLLVKHGDQLTYTVSGTFVGTWVVEKSDDAVNYSSVATGTAAASAVPIAVVSPGGNPVYYRFKCSAYTSGTMVTSVDDASYVVPAAQQYKDANGVVVMELVDGGVKMNGTLETVGAMTVGGSVVRASQGVSIMAAGKAKAGATAGWVVAAADNVALVTLPASQTGSTLVIPIHSLKVGCTITAFHLVGQIESAGGTVTVDAALRKQTAAAADVTDASLGAITQLAVTADTIMSSSNTSKTLATAEVVAADENFYVLITATTAAATDIALMGVVLTVTEA